MKKAPGEINDQSRTAGIAGTHDPNYQTLAAVGGDCFGADKKGGGAGNGPKAPMAQDQNKKAGTNDPNYQTLSAETLAVPINTSCRASPLLLGSYLYIPGLNEFVVVDIASMLVLNNLSLSNPMFMQPFLWKNYIIGICLSGEIVAVHSSDVDKKPYFCGVAPPTSETPIIFHENEDGSSIWLFSGYFESMLFAKIYLNAAKIIVEPLRRIIFPKFTGLTHPPVWIESYKIWAIASTRCHIFFFTNEEFCNVLAVDSSTNMKVRSAVLKPENSSFVKPVSLEFYRNFSLVLSTRNDSIVILDLNLKNG